MAKYQIKTDAFIRVEGEDVYFRASAEDPQIIEVPDDTEPSAKWIALDEGAKAAKKRLAEFRSLPKEKKEAEIRKRADELEAEEVRKAEASFKVSSRSVKEEPGGKHFAQGPGGTELSNPGHEKGKRPADKSPL